MTKPPWFGEYSHLDVPETLEPYPDWPVFRLLENAARERPRSGVWQLGREWRYADILDQSRRLAAALAGLGVRPGDRVATILPTSVQFVIADHAISIAGAVHIPSSFLEPPHVLEHKFLAGKPSALIFLAQDDGGAAEIAALCRACNITRLISTQLEDYSPAPPPEVDSPFFSFTRLIAGNPPAPDPAGLQPERDLETLLFTGGTTGLPKGCMLTHRNIVANAIQSSANFGPLNAALQGNFSALLAIPFFHSYGHMMMHTFTYLGATMLLTPDPRDTRGIITAIRENYPLFIFGVPTQYMNMLKEELRDIRVLGVSGSAALPTTVQEQFEKKGGGGIMEGYGLSECSPNTHLNPSLVIRMLGGSKRPEWQRELARKLLHYSTPLLSKADRKKMGRIFSRRLMPLLMKRAARATVKEDDRKGSIGIPFPDTLVRVIDETGRALSWEELAAGKTGELCLSGPQRMLGYWPDPGAGLDDEGYVRTGDVVRVDERGYFYIVDRTKDMIVVSGFKVYSREIDELLYGHPAVDAAATVGVPDPERPGSEWVKVFAQLKPGFEGKVQPEDLARFLRDKVARYAQPREVEIVTEMPLTSVGKVDKKALRTRT